MPLYKSQQTTHQQVQQGVGDAFILSAPANGFSQCLLAAQQHTMRTYVRMDAGKTSLSERESAMKRGTEENTVSLSLSHIRAYVRVYHPTSLIILRVCLPPSPATLKRTRMAGCNSSGCSLDSTLVVRG